MTDDSTVDFYDLYWFKKKDIIVILESFEIKKKTLVLYVVDSAIQQELLSTNVPIMPLSRFNLTERNANYINPI